MEKFEFEIQYSASLLSEQWDKDSFRHARTQNV